MRIHELLGEDVTALKTAITDLVKDTEDEALLNRVYTTLRSSDLVKRIKDALEDDNDTGNMLDSMARLIVNTDGSVEEKLAFADNFKNGFVHLDELFGGEAVTFDQFIAGGFPVRVFENLIPVIKHGVGPGELAFSVLSPQIKFTGQESGGGDLHVNGVGFVELKTEQVAGGRWINARKANMNTMAIKDAIQKVSGQKVPNRVNLNQWVQIREYIKERNPNQLKTLCKLIADSTFNHVDNTQYKNALLQGDAAAIKMAVLTVGFNNYKEYSGFDGLLIMSVPKRAARYFTDVNAMIPVIKSETPYVLAPESEMMPKVKIAL